MAKKFYICEKCGNIAEIIDASGVPLVCCGSKMTELVPGTVDASREKHIPVVSVEDGVVRVEIGSVAHPMSEEHSIEWVYLETSRGGQLKYLEPGREPKACFHLCHCEEPISVYAYCNLHGLWRADV